MTEQRLIGILFAAIISVSSYFARFLTFGGSLAQFVLGVVLLGLGGWQWTMPMLLFFLLSSLLSRFGREKKSEAARYFDKTSRRDLWQVIANGGVAGLVTLAWFFTHSEVLYVVYLGAVAAATADTWGTEVGMLARRNPILITTFKRVERGRSGGVSIRGLLAGLVGSYVIWLSSTAWLVSLDSSKTLISVLVGGVTASLFDSVLGATVQLQFRCVVCGKTTENAFHCGKTAIPASGFPLVNNDVVNLLSTIFGATLSAVAYVLL